MTTTPAPGRHPAAEAAIPPDTTERVPGWLLLTYKVPSQPSRSRVAVWRDLKRIGALYLQQAVCVFPDLPQLAEGVAAVRRRIAELEGTSFCARLATLDPHDERQLVEGFREKSERDYAEIVEECETKFFKEIEFERFRENFTYEEAEEIGQDLEKLRRWLEKAIDRDWLGAPGRSTAEQKVHQAAELLEEFEAEVSTRSEQGGDTAIERVTR